MFVKAAALAFASSGIPAIGEQVLSLAVAAPRTVDPVSALSPGQRVVLDHVLYADPVMYLAFAETIDRGSRGPAAAQSFEGALTTIRGLGPSEHATRLRAALEKRIVLDCLFTSGGVEKSITSAAASVALRAGMSELISRRGDTSTAVTDIASVVRSATRIEILPAVPSDVSQVFVRQGLRILAGSEGLTAFMAGAVAALAGTSNATIARGQAITTALADTAQHVRSFVDGFGKLGSASSMSASDVQKITINLGAAVEALGNAVGMNSQAVQSMKNAVDVAGAALSGAIAGAALGPVGAVVGGVIGLVGGLFGGGEDPTIHLDEKLSQLHQDMIVGFQQLSVAMQQSFADLSRQVEAGFQALSQQLKQFEVDVQQSLAVVESLLKSDIGQGIQDKVDGLSRITEEHERQYRESILSAGAYPSASAAQLRLSARALLDTIKTSGVGFCGPAFVGTDTFNKYMEQFSQKSATTSMRVQLPYLENFTGGLRVRPADVPSLSEEADALFLRLRNPRYELETGKGGAAIIHGVHRYCLAMLDDVAKAAEIESMTGNQRRLLPTSLPLAVAPLDLWDLAATMLASADRLSDTRAALEVVQIARDDVGRTVGIHNLLTGHDAIPALMYVRRRLAAKLANEISAVFCNPFVSAIDVFRRAICTAVSTKSAYGPKHSRLRVASLATAERMLSDRQRVAMPLARVSTLSLTGNFPEIEVVRQALGRFFGGLPGDNVRAAYALHVAAVETALLATRLPSAVKRVAGRDLSDHLVAIRDVCLTLGVVERCLGARVSALRAVGIAVPGVEMWFSGFEEYGTIAARALAAPLLNFLGSPPEFERAAAVIAAFLDPADTRITDPVLPANLPQEASPYPRSVGSLWGWRAEHCEPYVATPLHIVELLRRPECALAGSNGAISGTLEVLSSIDATARCFEMAPTLVSIWKEVYPQGLRDELKRQFAAS